MQDIINWFVTNWQVLLNIISYVVLAASLIVKLTPTPNDDTWFEKVINILKKLALYK
jgi:hypothetical protein